MLQDALAMGLAGAIFIGIAYVVQIIIAKSKGDQDDDDQNPK